MIPAQLLAAVGLVATGGRQRSPDPGGEQRRTIEGRQVPTHPRHDDHQSAQTGRRGQLEAIDQAFTPAEHQHDPEDNEQHDLFVAGHRRHSGRQAGHRCPAHGPLLPTTNRCIEETGDDRLGQGLGQQHRVVDPGARVDRHDRSRRDRRGVTRQPTSRPGRRHDRHQTQHAPGEAVPLGAVQPQQRPDGQIGRVGRRMAGGRLDIAFEVRPAVGVDVPVAPSQGVRLVVVVEGVATQDQRIRLCGFEARRPDRRRLDRPPHRDVHHPETESERHKGQDQKQGPARHLPDASEGAESGSGSRPSSREAMAREETARLTCIWPDFGLLSKMRHSTIIFGALIRPPGSDRTPAHPGRPCRSRQCLGRSAEASGERRGLDHRHAREGTPGPG